MADKRISELSPASLPLSGQEEFAVVQNGVSKKITAENAGISGDGSGETLRRVIRAGKTLNIPSEKQYLIHSEFTNLSTINIGGSATDLPGYSTHGELVVLNGFIRNEGIINNSGLIIV